MLVTLNVLLEGGHTHSCVCDDGDSTIVALVSALSGAHNVDETGQTGLIQVDLSHSGDRLFIKPESIVGIELVPFWSDAQRADASLGPVVQNCGIPTGAYASAACVVQPNLISTDICERASRVWDTSDAVDFDTPDELTSQITEAMAASIQETRRYLAVPDFVKGRLKYSVLDAKKGYSWPNRETPLDAQFLLNRPLCAVALISPSDAIGVDLVVYDHKINRANWVSSEFGRPFSLASGTAAVFQGHSAFELSPNNKGFILICELIVENEPS
ncbi:MAG: hypothetical protein AAFP97_03840 [Pseudomonadota bacterium]